MRQTLLVLCCTAILACKTTEPVHIAIPATPPAPVEAPKPPPEPVVTLDAAPALPAMPKGLGEVKAPDDNALTPEKAALGQLLFFDKRLSKDDSASCESCHHIDKAYTSGQALDAKVGGAMNKRNAPSMLNLGFHTSFYWDGRMPTLEACSGAAWKGQLGADQAQVAQKLNAVPVYKAMFLRAFNEPASAENVPRAIASWLRTLQSGNSAWDRFSAGDKTALTKDAQAGWAVFQKAQCSACHVPPLFSDFDFHHVGLGDDAGRKDATKADADLGKFKTPSLRNVALTGPYFHDGSAASLDDAIAFMARGGNKSGDTKLKAVKLSAKESAQLKAFLESLTGESTYTSAPALP
jgi:cytochrome c peroxidase